METSPKQAAASRQNGKKSNGPKTQAGKATSARNSIRHGILSNRLFLPGENQKDFDHVFNGLCDDFKPFGLFESFLVEKIATLIWKSRRIVAAENAEIEVSQHERRLSSCINSVVGKELRNDDFISRLDDIAPYQQALDESSKILDDDDIDEITLEVIENHAPAMYEQLEEEAGWNHDSIDDFIQDGKHKGNLKMWFYDYRGSCIQLIEEHEARCKNSALLETLRHGQSVLGEESRDSFDRYQTSIDRQISRAINELTAIQERRMGK